MDKGADAFRTISEVADDLDLPQHVLRFWETRFKQIKPMKRGGGRRYYRPDDVDLLRGIRGLLYDEGYTIRGVQRLLKEHGNRVAIEFAQTGQIGGFAENGSDYEGDGGSEAGPSKPEPAKEQSKPAVSVSQFASGGGTDARQGGILGRLASAATGNRGAAGDKEPLARSDMEILKSTLQDLLECKRLLDQTRQN